MGTAARAATAGKVKGQSRGSRRAVKVNREKGLSVAGTVYFMAV